jgi:hypothetical protein
VELVVYEALGDLSPRGVLEISARFRDASSQNWTLSRFPVRPIQVAKLRRAEGPPLQSNGGDRCSSEQDSQSIITPSGGGGVGMRARVENKQVIENIRRSNRANRRNWGEGWCDTKTIWLIRFGVNS